MTVTLEVLTPDGIEATRARLLADAGMTLQQMRDKARVYALTSQEQGILDQLEDLEYLSESA